MRSLKHILATGTILGLLLAVCSPVSALTLMAGSDYLETTSPGTFLDFDAYASAFSLPLPPIGLVEFEGDPIGPGGTDTIVRRLDDAELTTEGDSDIIDIELVALSLVSVAPVNIGGTDFDLSIILSSTPSMGQMTITLDDETGVSGHFESSFFVFFDIQLFVAGTDTLFDTMIGLPPLQMQGSGFWDSTPLPGTVVVPGDYGDLDANAHTPPGSDFFDFYISGDVVEEHPDLSVHTAHPAPVPEPATLSLLGMGLAALAVRARRKKVAQY